MGGPALLPALRDPPIIGDLLGWSGHLLCPRTRTAIERGEGSPYAR